jgi:hypothetical protein
MSFDNLTTFNIYLEKQEIYVKLDKAKIAFEKSKIAQRLWNEKSRSKDKTITTKIHFDEEIEEMDKNLAQYDKMKINHWLDLCFAPGYQSKYVKGKYPKATGIGFTLPLEDSGYRVEKGICDKRFKCHYINILRNFPKIKGLVNEYPHTFDYLHIDCMARHNKESRKNLRIVDIRLQLIGLYLGIPKLTQNKSSSIVLLYSQKDMLNLFNLCFILSKYCKKITFFKSAKYFNYRSILYIKCTEFYNFNPSFLVRYILDGTIINTVLFDKEFVDEYLIKLEKHFEVQIKSLMDVIKGKVKKLYY